MAQRCEYAENNTYGKIICTVGENRLCIFQRYCSKASEWQNSKAFSTCERRRDMAKNKNRAIKIENEQVENVRAKAYIETEQVNNNIEEKVELVENTLAIEKPLIIEEKEIIENPVIIEKPVVIKKEKKRTGTVICVSKLSVVVKDENGKGYTIYDRPDAKCGDIIEF